MKESIQAVECFSRFIPYPSALIPFFQAIPHAPLRILVSQNIRV
ncbi:MAG TPA: hypothetical protein VF656_15665 [Pyrinomonadaceae bacterium]|jgi:hypothetical protein